MLELLKTLGFTEKYIQEVNDMFSSFPYCNAICLSDTDMPGAESRLNSFRKRYNGGKNVTGYKQRFVDQYYDYADLFFNNEKIKKSSFTVKDCFHEINIHYYDYDKMCEVPFDLTLDLSEFKAENRIMRFMSLGNIDITPYYDDMKYNEYDVSINTKNINLITSELIIYGTMTNDPLGVYDGGFGRTLLEGNDDATTLDLSFTAEYIPFSDTEKLPKWLDVFSESILFYKRGLYIDAIFKAFSALDNIIELTYKYIETLAKEMDIQKSMPDKKYGKFVKEYTGCERRIIYDKLYSVLRMLGTDNDTKSQIISELSYYEKVRNSIAHGNDVNQVINMDGKNLSLKERVKEFYHCFFKLIYLFAYNDSLIDHILLIIDFDRCDEPYSIEI